MSTTGKNVANMQDEFGLNPLKCSAQNIFVAKRDIPENGNLNLELLETLLSIRAAECEPDIVSNLDFLIDMVCVE